jgi:alkylation response protein AidB-like acyl-CoA dehydrogenase
MGYLELCVIAEEIGRSAAPVPFSTAVYLAGELLLAAATEAQKEELVGGLATGNRIGTLALAEGPGEPGIDNIACTVSGGRVTGRKVPVPDAATADYAIVAARDEHGVSLYIASLEQPAAAVTPVATVDPSRAFYTIEFTGADVEPLGTPGGGFDTIEAAFDRAAVLLAFEQIGGAQAALDMACRHATERYAFGRAIGSFQAIKHRLAELYVSLELARSNCYHGGWALSTGAGELPIAAVASHLAASQAYYECARENIQVHGGMGFTWESDCHLHYRRAKLLSLALGGQRAWKNRLIDRLQAGHAETTGLAGAA